MTDAAISHPSLMQYRRIERRLRPSHPAPPLAPRTRCLEHPYTYARKFIRGIGPLCVPCINDLPGDSSHRYRSPIYPCGCYGTVGKMCPFARSLYQRACKAHRLAVGLPEGHPRIPRLYTAYSAMLAALRTHRGGSR